MKKVKLLENVELKKHTIGFQGKGFHGELFHGGTGEPFTNFGVEVIVTSNTQPIEISDAIIIQVRSECEK